MARTKAPKMAYTAAWVGVDMQGDACLYIARYDENMEFVEYLSTVELEALADKLNAEFPRLGK